MSTHSNQKMKKKKNTYDQCALHNRQCEMFCRDCQTSVCAECAVLSGHRGHNIGMKDNIRKENSSFFKQSESKINELEDLVNGDVKFLLQTMDGEEQEMKEEVERKFGEVLGRLKEREKRALEDVEDAWKRKKGQVVLIEEEIAKVKSLLKESQQKDNNFSGDLVHKREIEGSLEKLSTKLGQIVNNDVQATIVQTVRITSSKSGQKPGYPTSTM